MLAKIEEIAKVACNSNGVALYDVDIRNTNKGKIVLVYITKIGGVSVDDCVNVSKTISQTLDTEEFLSKKYFLEVSSPGIERKLKLKKHYVGAINEMIKLTINTDDAKKTTVVGKLLEVQQNFVIVEIKNNEVQQFEYKDIKKAKTYFKI